MTIEELFGTLQQSVIAGWRKHLKTYKYSKHMALDEFYNEMPEKVDALIEAWMGANGKKVNSFTNIITSKNMGTLVYLKELRKVVKQGYALMNGEPELEALMDDIVELIDSTLYKVKELSESSMVDLKDFINESLNINEAKDTICFAWNHYNPSVLYCMIGDAKKAEKICKDTGYNFDNLNLKGPICSVMWNDEYLAALDCKGSNLNAVKANELKNLQNQIDNCDNDDTYKYLDCSMFCGSGEWYDDDASSNDAKDYLDRFIKMIDDSEVDGDSSYGRAVIDIKKGEVLLSGQCEIAFITVNEFEEMFS